MSCYEYLSGLMNDMGIDLVSSIPISECKIIREYKLVPQYFDSTKDLCVYMIAVPYRCRDEEKSNISQYAISRDYHLFFRELFDNVLRELQKRYPSNRFCAFTDSSPIDEVDAAARSGLGIIGKNRLLITEKYSSFVFLGEIITDLKEDTPAPHAPKMCEMCGACMSHCPMMKHGICLSMLTQKKGELTEDEKSIIKEYKSAWGCDICQTVCPHTLKAEKSGTLYTNIEFFKLARTPYLTRELIESMDDDEFSRRAYSWRKRSTVLRNLDLICGADDAHKGKE